MLILYHRRLLVIHSGAILCIHAWLPYRLIDIVVPPSFAYPFLEAWWTLQLCIVQHIHISILPLVMATERITRNQIVSEPLENRSGIGTVCDKFRIRPSRGTVKPPESNPAQQFQGTAPEPRKVALGASETHK